MQIVFAWPPEERNVPLKVLAHGAGEFGFPMGKFKMVDEQ